MNDQNSKYDNPEDMPPEFIPADYDKDTSENGSGYNDDFDNSLFGGKREIAAVVAVCVIAIAIVASIVFFLFTTNSNSAKHDNVSEPTKNCVRLRKDLLSEQKNLQATLSSDDVSNAIEIKTYDFVVNSDEAKSAFDDFESSLNYVKTDLNEKIQNCPVGADSSNSPSVEDKFSGKIENFRQDNDSLKKSAYNAVKAAKSVISAKLVKLVSQGKDLIDKTKNIPVLSQAKDELQKIVDLANQALNNSNNNNIKEMKQCIDDLKKAFDQYLEKIKNLSSNFLNRDGNGYPLSSQHQKDDDGGYVPSGRDDNSDSVDPDYIDTQDSQDSQSGQDGQN